MSGFDRLKKLGMAVGIVEEVPDAVPAPALQPPVAHYGASTPIPFPVPVTIAPVTFVPPERLIELDRQAKATLENALNAAPPGYKELTDSVSTLLETIPDEAVAYKSALKLLVKKGHPVPSLLSDIDASIGILESQNHKFQDSVKAQIDTKVGGRRATVQQLEATIQQKRDQIAALQNEITQLDQQRQSEMASITSDTQSISQVQERFTVVYNSIHASLDALKMKVSTYGKGL